MIEISDRHREDRALVDANRVKEKVAAKHLLELINDVLEFNKLDEENLQLTKEPFCLKKLWQEIITIVEPRAADKGILLKYEEQTEGAFPRDKKLVICCARGRFSTDLYQYFGECDQIYGCRRTCPVSGDDKGDRGKPDILPDRDFG